MEGICPWHAHSLPKMYPLVCKLSHNYGKSPLLMGKSTISTGPFSSSQTVNVYWRVLPCSQELCYKCVSLVCCSLVFPSEWAHYTRFSGVFPPWGAGEHGLLRWRRSLDSRQQILGPTMWSKWLWKSSPKKALWFLDGFLSSFLFISPTTLPVYHGIPHFQTHPNGRSLNIGFFELIFRRPHGSTSPVKKKTGRICREKSTCF